jgi:hypothetical protein
MNHPFKNGLYHFIPPIDGEMVDVFFIVLPTLFQQVVAPETLLDRPSMRCKTCSRSAGQLDG